jgi:peptide/nickel transport system substrate-binding protein
MSRGASRRSIAGILPALPLLLGLASCTREAPRTADGVLVVKQEQQASWVRNFNPLTPATTPRWPTLCGIYEPLYVFNSVRSEYVPWLAVRHAWSADHRTLRMTTRQGVTWSDGQPFTARDVAFTMQLLKDHPGLDRRGLWGFLDGVTAPDDSTVEFHFGRVFVPGLDEIAAQLIVPEHVWSHVEDPVAFPNENPVATGPFTEVRVFRSQVFELGRNPNYWQKGRPRIEALRFPAFPANDRANLALVFDEIDWAGSFIPAIDRVYVSRDPEHHKYWFPLTGTTVFLYANTTEPPYDQVAVRKALSMAIDRQFLVDVAAFRYTRPADATGLSDSYTAWHSPEIAAEGDWVTYDRARANRMLDEAGFPRGDDGIRRLPDGRRWKHEILVVAGWSDWVRACQVIALGFQEIGIQASVRTYDFSAWYQRVQNGEFDLSIGWSYEGPTPYLFYRWLMSSATVKPVGEPARGTWHRYGSPEADRALQAFERESDPAALHRLSDDLQRTFVAEAPAIPLYPNPSWAEYNTKRFSGFPSPENPYANPSPNAFDRGEVLLVLTTVSATHGETP